MPYLGQRPSKGDENNFKILDDISSYTLTFDGSDSSVVSAANDTITSLNHRFVQGQRVTYTDGDGSAIAGLTDATVYFIIKEDHNTIKLATSASNASNGVAVNITNVGSGSSHTLNVAFDGVNTKFKATHTTGQKAKITRSAQLVISMNGVIQQPHDTATPSTGFGFDLDGTIVFSQAPVSSDVFWAHVLTNNNVTFDISDNDIDNFTGDGSTVSFNLSKTPPDNRNILVTVDGVVQYPNDPDGTERSYTVVENVLTFSVAPALGTEVQVRHIGFAGSSSGSGSGGVTSVYGRTGAVVLKSTDNITVNDAAITGNATVTGNLTVNGTTTTLDTQLVEVDKIEVETTSTNVAVAVTHNGSGDLIRLHDGASQVVTIDDEGKIGINSTSPREKLDVIGNANIIVDNNRGIKLGYRGENKTAYIGLDANDAANAGTQSWANSAYIGFYSDGSSERSITYRTNVGSHIFQGTNGEEFARINSTGSVGIGTNNPVTELEVHGDSGGTIRLAKGGTNRTTVLAGDTLGKIEFRSYDASLNYNSFSGTYAEIETVVTNDLGGLPSEEVRLDFKIADSDEPASGKVITPVPALSILQGGSVGIGSTIPLSAMALDVVGSIRFSNQSRAAGGSQSEPSYAFYSDHDTGMYRSGTNALSFATAGTQRLRIGASGTANFYSPAAAWHEGPAVLEASNGYAAIFFRSTGSTHGTSVTGTWSVGKLAGTDGFAILKNSMTGGGGIRQDAPINISNAGDTTIGFNLGVGVAPSSIIHATGSNSSIGYQFINTHATSGFGVKIKGGGSTADRYSLRVDNAADDELFRVNANGRVGIGTYIPAFKLDLRNTGQADLLIGSYNAGGARLMLDGDSNGDGSGGDFCEIMADTGGDLTINARNPADDAELIFKTGGGTEKLRITGIGSVGVNIINPFAQFQVNSTKNAETDRFHAENYHLALRNPEDDTGEAIGISFGITSNTHKVGASILHERDAGGSQGSLQFYTSSDGNSISERIRINANGSIQITPEGSTSNPYMLIDTSGDSVRFSAQKSSGNNEFRFSTQTSGTASEALRITHDGYLHLGNSGHGTNKVGGQAVTGNDFDPIFKIYNSTASKWLMHLRNDNSTAPNGIFMRAGNASDNYTLYLTGGDEHYPSFVLTGNGNVGIGTDAPSFVDINSVSSGNVKGIEIFRDGTNTASALRLSGDNGSGNKAYCQFGYSGADATAHWTNYNTVGQYQTEIVMNGNRVGINTTVPSGRGGSLDISCGVNDTAGHGQFTDMRAHSMLTLRNDSDQLYSYTQMMFTATGGTVPATILRHTRGGYLQDENFVGDLLLMRRTGNNGGANNDFRDSTIWPGGNHNARQIWWTNGTGDTTNHTKMGWHHISQQNPQGNSQYNYFELRLGAYNYSRAGLCKYTILWSTGHASGTGHQTGEFRWWNHHSAETCVVQDHVIFRRAYSSGSYYGWNDAPLMKLFSCTDDENDAGIYLRCQGRRSSGYDMGLYVSIFLDIYAPQSSNGNVTPTLTAKGTSEPSNFGSEFLNDGGNSGTSRNASFTTFQTATPTLTDLP